MAMQEMGPIEKLSEMIGSVAQSLPPELGERMAAVQQEFNAIVQSASGGGAAPQQGGAVPAEQQGIPAGPQGAV